MNKYNIFSKKAYNVSLIILLFLISILIISNIGFFINITIGRYTFVIALMFTIAIFLFFFGLNKESVVDICIFALVCIITVIISAYIIDTSYDGNSYHKTAIGTIKNGANPIKDDFTKVLRSLGIEGEDHHLWIEHYANGGWVIAAVFYSFFGLIECGKAFNLLTVIVFFGILNYYLTTRLSKRASLIISILASFSPIVCSQISSYYNDSVLTIYVMLCVLSLFIISDNRVDINRMYSWFVLAASIIICGNIKFTGLAYVGFFSIGFYAIWLIRAYREKNGAFKKDIKKYTAFFAVVVVITVGIVGFSSYICNFIDKGNPLYPLIGKDKVDIMWFNQPEIFEEYNNVSKLAYSVFSKTDDIAVNINADNPQLKIPFSISKSEILTCKECTDIRIAGFGPWFSGVLILSLIINVIGIIRLFKCNNDNSVLSDNKSNNYIGYRYLGVQISVVMTIIILLLFFMEGSWWARYSGYSYMLIIFAMIFAFAYLEHLKEKKKTDNKIICYIFLIAIIVNTAIMSLQIARNITYSYKQHKEYSYLEDMSKNKTIEIAIGDEMFTGFIFNLMDNNIKYKLVEIKTGEEKTYTVISEQCSYRISEEE